MAIWLDRDDSNALYCINALDSKQNYSWSDQIQKSWSMENLQSSIVMLLCMLNGKVSYEFLSFCVFCLVSSYFMFSLGQFPIPLPVSLLCLSVSSKASILMRKSKTKFTHTNRERERDRQPKNVQPALIIWW